MTELCPCGTAACSAADVAKRLNEVSTKLSKADTKRYCAMFQKSGEVHLQKLSAALWDTVNAASTRCLTALAICLDRPCCFPCAFRESQASLYIHGRRGEHAACGLVASLFAPRPDHLTDKPELVTCIPCIMAGVIPLDQEGIGIALLAEAA